MDCLRDSLRRSTALAALLLLALPACAPKSSDSQNDTDTETVSPASTASSSEGGTGTSGAGAPPCAERVSEETCNADYGAGTADYLPLCAWVEVFTSPPPPKQCDLGDAVGRCIDVEYVGDGCAASDCATYDRVYYRSIPEHMIEIFVYDGYCGEEPDGWYQCYVNDDGDHPPVCDCLCD